MRMNVRASKYGVPASAGKAHLRHLLPAPAEAGTPYLKAFTIIELLVVIAIIGALTAISLPAIKGISQSHTVNSASRQLLDDLGLARQYAIHNRAVVHVLFVPPLITNLFPIAPTTPQLAKRLMGGIYSSYA